MSLARLRIERVDVPIEAADVDTAVRHGGSRGESTVGFERPQLPFGGQSFDGVIAGRAETPGRAAQTDGDRFEDGTTVGHE
ncbi:hypothetical protein [Natrinema pallidum]|nr:hypothetical protein [Natrinema pallidum]